MVSDYIKNFVKALDVLKENKVNFKLYSKNDCHYLISINGNIRISKDEYNYIKEYIHE